EYDILAHARHGTLIEPANIMIGHNRVAICIRAHTDHWGTQPNRADIHPDWRLRIVALGWRSRCCRDYRRYGKEW
ncbi:MAG: hypothetical protein CV045_12820, partial [Cyanobacteria bacterium M5B4]